MILCRVLRIVDNKRIGSAFRLIFVEVFLQLSFMFELKDAYKVGLVIGAVIATVFLPVLFRNIFPKGHLTAVIDPIVE